MGKALIGVVRTLSQAEAVVRDMQVAGVATEYISVLFPNQAGTKDFAHEHHTKAPEGAVAGVGAGGAVGGVIGLLAGIGALAIPGLGPFIAAGPLMAALSGLAAGGVVGGVVGALAGLGIPEYEAKIYEGKLKQGHILLAVHTEDAHTRKLAEQAMKAGGAVDITTVSEASVPNKDKPEQVRVERPRKDVRP